MVALFFASSAFVVALICHWIYWRIALPKTQLKTLLFVFLVVFVAAIPVSVGLSKFLADMPYIVSLLYFVLIYWAAALCYVITYSAMEGDSPTLSLTRHLHRKGGAGISHEEVEEFFRQRPFVRARVKALVTDNIFIEESGGYRLASGKYLFFRLILGYRRVVFGPIKSGG
jgi:hypothetical protein